MIVGTSNAVNLTDGLDGLAAGTIALAAFALGVMAYIKGNFYNSKISQYGFHPECWRINHFSYQL